MLAAAAVEISIGSAAAGTSAIRSACVAIAGAWPGSGAVEVQGKGGGKVKERQWKDGSGKALAKTRQWRGSAAEAAGRQWQVNEWQWKLNERQCCRGRRGAFNTWPGT